MAELERLREAWRTAFAREAFLRLLGSRETGKVWAESAFYEPLAPETARVSGRRVIAAAAPLLAGIPAPAEGWADFTLNFAVSRIFPNHKKDALPEQDDAALCLILALQLLYDEERRVLPFDPALDFAFCTEDELAADARREEYRKFRNAWKSCAIYEILRLSEELTPYCTLRHIAGVHHVAMTAARELKKSGAPLDLSLVSAAAAGHDIGKYGCMPDERVPYLHYYYTDYWFTSVGLPGIGQIAANHSTWDLELQNLSAESMLLIYADFRVKQSRVDGREVTTLYDLDEAFGVILAKLDNVDEAKRRRYRLVYRKLHDFEEYMQARGVDVTLSGRPRPQQPTQDAALMSAEETYTALRMMAVDHNLTMMHRFSQERLFASVLEAAGSEKDWGKLRAYLCVFEEYVTYLSPGQKTQTLRFLYELLLDREGDIRRQAAALLGRMIARFNLRYKKELPASASRDELDLTQFELWKQYLQMLVYPDRKLTPQQRSHIHFTMKLVVSAVLESCNPADARGFLEGLLPYYREPELEDEDAALALTDTLSYLTLAAMEPDDVCVLSRFAEKQLGRQSLPLQTAALNFFCYAAETLPSGHPARACFARVLRAETLSVPALGYLSSRFQKLCKGRGELPDRFSAADIFVDNLKTATPWILKKVNIELLTDQVVSGQKENILHIAAHFSNLIKASETVVVRYSAAQALLTIAPYLSFDQRNEIAFELGKGLEVGQYEFSKYIPQCLGEFSLYLRPTELDELISHMQELTCHSNDSVVTAALDTVGVMLEHSGVYAQRYPEPGDVQEKRRRKMTGILLKGMASYREAVQREAMFIFGETLFASEVFSREDKAWLFTLCAHKLLFLMVENKESSLIYLYSSALLYHIYRFIILYEVDCGGFHFRAHRKIAFFPGTFDPFTLSHKAIVQAIRDLGFEVYLAIDEFSWSKKTQPSLIRRQIASMSVADEFHVYIFPHNIPVNIANPADLRRLKSLFPGCEVYLTVGSDVIRGASSYRVPPCEDSVHSMNHIVFRRVSELHGPEQSGTPEVNVITGHVIELQLPSQLEDISSTRIRENIDLNRDISNLIDPVVQEFIYQRGLYLREPQYKPILEAGTLKFERFSGQREEAALPALRALGLPHEQAAQAAAGIAARKDEIVTLSAGGAEPRMLALLSVRIARVTELFPILRDTEQVTRVRNRTSGRLLLLTGVYAADEDGLQMLLTETMTDALQQDCTAALCAPLDLQPSRMVSLMLRCQGFFFLEGEAGPMLVDLNSPVVLLQNVETTIKAPFSNDPRVLETIRRTRRQLKLALVDMYPGRLILPVSTALLHHRLLEKITALNGVPMTPTSPRVLGPDMCVPFGKLLRGHAVPNTVTKTVHTDKVFTQDLRAQSIEAFPHYPPLRDQIRTIKSFGRPVVLVDDLLHTGNRIRVIDPLARDEGVEIREVLVGILSGQGRDLMAQRGRSVDCVYFVPNLRAWYVESTLYPFIGGDSVRCDRERDAVFQPSVNLILPYAYPAHHQVCPQPAVYNFSKTCLENTWKILLALESAYRAAFAKNLTLSRLGEAIVLPLCPDKGRLEYDPSLAVSSFLESDLAELDRLRDLFQKKEFTDELLSY